MNWNKLLLIVIVLGCVEFVDAQSTNTYQLLDSESKEAVIYANIGIKNSKSGTVSDAGGKFSIQHKSNNDSIIISSLGYETQTWCFCDLTNGQKIMMNPEAYLIEELVISSKTYDQHVILGERNEGGRGHSFAFGSAQLGTELGVAIKIEKETIIEKVNFVLNHAKGDSLLFRINIYDYTNGIIGDKVLRQNVYLKDKQRKGTFSIDMSAYNLILSNDVLLSIEWLRNFDELGNKSITFDTKKSKSLKGTFIKYSSQSEFNKMDYKKVYKPCIYFVGKQSSS